MRLKNLNLSVVEENGEMFFNVDIPADKTVNKTTLEVATQEQPSTNAIGWCTSPTGLNVRDNADLNATKVGVLKYAEEFTIASTVSSNNMTWYKITVPFVGYIDKAYTTTTGNPAPASTAGEYNFGWCTSPVGLKIQASSSVDSNVVGVLENGQRFKIAGTLENAGTTWYKITAPLSGYIDKQYTNVSSDTTDIDSSLVDFTASWEGFRARAYQDAGGNWTIGFGDCTFKDKPTYTVTYQEVLNTLQSTLKNFASQVATITQGLNLNSNQFNACVDFCYNVGIDAFKSSDLLANIKECLNNATITADFTAWDHCGSEVVPGLLSRRTAEATMFLYGEYKDN